MQVCPYCGQILHQVLKDGITNCLNCNQLFDSSDYNFILSAAWQVRKNNLSYERMKSELKLDEDFCILVQAFVGDYDYSHDEFVKVLKKLGVANKSYIDYLK